MPKRDHAYTRMRGSQAHAHEHARTRSMRHSCADMRETLNYYVVKFVCKFVCSVGGQSYSNTDPSGIHCNLRTLNCCMTESVRNQYRPLRWLEIAGSGIRTRARARAITRADRSTNQASRKSHAN